MPEHFNSLEEAGEFWDTHDTTDYEEFMIPVHFDVDLKPGVQGVQIAKELLRDVKRIARQQGLKPEALINLWLQEKISQHQKRVTKKPRHTARKHSTKKTTRAQNGAARSVKA